MKIIKSYLITTSFKSVILTKGYFIIIIIAIISFFKNTINIIRIIARLFMTSVLLFIKHLP